MKLIVISALIFSLSAVGLFDGVHNGHTVIVDAASVRTAPPIVNFRLNPARSTFMVHADRAGLFWFKGKSHRIAPKDFSGEASLSLDSVTPASLTINIKSASLEETRPIFTAQEKGIINKELNEIVLEPAKYPDITFKSTDVKGSVKNGAFDVRIIGDLTLHGVTRQVTVPATVTLEGDTLRAKGEFKLNRKKFGVNATQAFHGFVKVRHTLKFVFDIIGEKVQG